jgi:hypothetical protein
VQLLADSGANLDAKNKRGQTPLAALSARSLRAPSVDSGAGDGRQSTADLLRTLGAKE